MIPLLHTPEGVRDIYGDEMVYMEQLSDSIKKTMQLYGFEEIRTPAFEYFDVFSSERGTVPSKDMYKFIDRDGNTLVLRPDMTPQVARATATYFREETMPIRLSYFGNTFINNSGYQLRLKETTQAGVELFGDDSVAADAEILALTVECLKNAGLTEFQIEVGNAGFFRAIANECGLSAEDEEELRQRIKSKNLFGITDLLRERNIEGRAADLLLTIPELFGSEDILDRAASLTDNQAALAAVDRLRRLSECLKYYGVERYVSFDLGMLSKYRYYTGIIFRAITYGTGEAVASGGRYDTLAEQFGRPIPAIGMSVTVDTLMLAMERQGILPQLKREEMTVLYTEEQTERAIDEAKKLRADGKTVKLIPVSKDNAETVSAMLREKGVNVWNI
ncbi:MAG: ATP phosphoribosyltransferase regulatory subunit [Lachnospiraceae bacterium]|nr:ATP phosphoribosyltransferase regulatory subunit [Lachnospiraceae bacterium]